MQFTFRPKGVCCREMQITIEDGLIKSLQVLGGCAGNLQGLCKLVEDMPVDHVIARLAGIPCKEKQTSCPDQLSTALKEAMAR